MSTAFVLWGAGSLGAAQVGMLRALTAAGIRADLVVGASVGALNGVYYAARPDPDGIEELAAIWRRISAHDVFPLSGSELAAALRAGSGLARALGMRNYVFPLTPTTLLAAALGRVNYLVDHRRLAGFLRHALPISLLEETTIPVEVLTTDLHDAASVPQVTGPALPALLASTAIPTVYPTVKLDGRTLVDGALAAHTGLDRAVQLGADEIYLLTPGYSCDLAAPPANVLAMAVHSHNMLAEQRITSSLARVPEGVAVHQLPPLCPIDVLPVDFAHTNELIERAAARSTAWLEESAYSPSGSEHLPAHHQRCGGF